MWKFWYLVCLIKHHIWTGSVGSNYHTCLRCGKLEGEIHYQDDFPMI